MRFILYYSFTVKHITINEHNESFEKPCVIIANHQSSIDIAMLLALYPKLIMLTNDMVWNIPIVGKVARNADFYNSDQGYENLVETLKVQIEDGYSVVVFPEGTRSLDGRIKRFHKGAFFLAEKLEIDVVPVVLYGVGLICSKNQGFYVKKGTIVTKTLKRITKDDASFGKSYSERTKQISRYFKKEYNELYQEFNRADNAYFYDALVKNYTYKGPVLEWYMRIKIRMENCYKFFDQIIPRKCSVVDIGCGYGPLSYILSLLSDQRTVTGIDYDNQKISLANHSFSKNERLKFIHADALSYDFPQADVFVLNDVLHYMDFKSQDALLCKCFEKMEENTMILIRDGDASQNKKHKLTKLTEKWSTQITGFNKTVGDLHFTSSERIKIIAEKYNLQVKIKQNDKRSSNTIYIITKNTTDDAKI